MIRINNKMFKSMAVFALVSLYGGAPSRANSDAVIAYEQQLQSISLTLTAHDYYQNYSKENQNQQFNTGPCSPVFFCKNVDIEKRLMAIQTGDFEFIPPVMVPSNAQELLSDIQSLSSCKDLGFMNVSDILGQGPEPSKTVPYRPTEGFGVYDLPIVGHKILLVRGSEYNVAWPFWGADTSGVKLPPIPPSANSLGADFLTEVDAKDCYVIEQFNVERLQVFTETNYKHESFSEPILIDKQVYVLQIQGDKSFNNQPVYQLELIKLDSFTGKAMGNFNYSTFFEKQA